jgi:FkbM family methyltransferase
VDTLNGRLTFWSDDWVIGRQLYVERSYELDVVNAAVGLLRREGYLTPPGKGVLLDVGANVGMTCIGMLKQGYFESALAFEPAPRTYQLLEINVRQNGMSNRIQPFPYALSEEDATVELELSSNNSGDHRVRLSRQPDALKEHRRGTVPIAAKALDHVLSSDETLLGGREIHLIWADVQGHEGQFLKGARRLLSRGIPVASEFWPSAILRSGMTQADYCAIVSDLFTHFYVLVEGEDRRRPIAEFPQLFEKFQSPDKWCNIILFRDRTLSA